MLRNGRVHVVPRLYVRNEKIHLRAKPAWIVEATGSHSYKAGWPIIRFSAGESRSAVGAEAAFVLAARTVSPHSNGFVGLRTVITAQESR